MKSRKRSSHDSSDDEINDYRILELSKGYLMVIVLKKIYPLIHSLLHILKVVELLEFYNLTGFITH